MGMWRRNQGAASPVELRLAVRALARNPLFTLASVLTLALAIGANTAIFSVVERVLLRPLPYDEPGHLVAVVLSFRSDRGERVIPASEPEFLEVREGHTALKALAGYWVGSANLGGGEEPVRVRSASVSADFLTTLGVQPRLGRGFLPAEDEPGRDGVVMLSDGLWHRAFGSDPSVVGREILLDGAPRSVVGILPPGFIFPDGEVDLLRTNAIDRANPAGRSSHYITMVGRLRDGVDLEEARTRNRELLEQWQRQRAGVHGPSPTHPLTLRPLRDVMVGEVRQGLVLLLGAVGLVLLIACANVASLFVVRGEQRQRETGVRIALGASLGTVSRMFLMESALVSGLGGALGLLLAMLAFGLVEQAGPEVLRTMGGLHMDLGVLVFTATLTIGCTLLFGIAPAGTASRGDPLRHLRDEGRAGTGGRDRLLLRRGLVICEIALAVTLVAASGLTLRSFERLQSVDPGFDPDGVVTLEFSLDRGRYPEPASVVAFHERLAERLDGMAGIRASGAIRSLPFAYATGIESLRPLDRALPEGEFWNAGYQIASPGYFEAMRIPLLEGRFFSATDLAEAPSVVIVSAAMVDRFWQGDSPLGERIQLGPPEMGTPEMTVVGVVGDVRQGGFDAGIAPFFYVPRAQAGTIYDGLGTRLATLVVRTDLDPAVALRTVRGAIGEIDPGLPVVRMASMPSVMSRSVTDARFLTVLVGGFSGLALILGAVGIGGLVSYVVTRRTRELGLRLALGAPRGRILRLILGQALFLTGVGVALGLLGALGAGRLLAGQLFEIGQRDPVALATASLILFAVSVVAAWVPALRATRVDPVEAMRSE
jgi:putative ABC transport system permease protein